MKALRSMSSRSVRNMSHLYKESSFVYRFHSPEAKNKKIALLLIDPQNDFIADWGTLKVEGAEADSKRVGEAIKANLSSISQVFVTLDTHQQLHVAHPLFWKAQDGSHPVPFTQITQEDVKSGKWKTTLEKLQSWGEKYVSELEKIGKFKLTIWPEHCLVGTEGHAVFPYLQEALHDWEKTNLTAVSYLLKGTNALTEHYSCFRAEVPREDDGKTALNLGFIHELDEYDEIVIAGQALSHCVNYSVRDLVANLPKKQDAKKIVVLSDGCSTIKGFEEDAKAFQTDMEKCGVRFLTTAEVFK